MKKKFKIPEPCPEKWSSMAPTEKGRYCKVCQKEIFDFTQKNGKEIYEDVINTEGTVCGRFRNDQVIIPTGQKTHKFSLKTLPFVFSSLLAPFRQPKRNDNYNHD